MKYASTFHGGPDNCFARASTLEKPTFEDPEHPDQATLGRWEGRFICDCGAVRRTYRGIQKHRSAMRCGE